MPRLPGDGVFHGGRLHGGGSAMLEINDKSCLTLLDSSVLQSIPELDHYYAFDTFSGEQYQLNESAYWVLNKIGKGISFKELLSRFASEYDLDEEVSRKDLLDVLQFALNNNIIKEEEP
jgi:hypothetical protein